MEEHKCNQEAVIGEMHGLLKRMVQQVYGNGQKGLATTVPELSTRIETLSEDIVLLSTNVSGLMRFMSETEGAKSQGEKDGFSARQRAGIIVTGIIGVTMIVITIVFKFL